MLSAVSLSRGSSQRLKPLDRIGVGFAPDKWGWMSYVAFSPDGTMVASDGWTGSTETSTSVPNDLSIWSFPQGKLIEHLPVGADFLSPNWKFFASGDGIGEVDNNKLLVHVQRGSQAAFAFSPDDKYAAEVISVGHAGARQIKVISLTSEKEINSFGSHQPSSISISPDGTTLAAGYWNTVALWNIFTGQRLATFHGLGRYVDSLSFSPDGKLLAAGTDLGGLELWNVPDHKKVWTLNFDGQYVSEPAFSPDGKLAAIGVYGAGTVWLIDVQTGKILDHQKVSDLGCGSVAFSPDGRYLITPSTGGLVKWPYDRGGTVRVFEIETH